jgi:hypothetical protein
MRIRVSQGAINTTGRDWFVVHPLHGDGHNAAVMSLLSAGRAVYEMDLPDDPNDPSGVYMQGTWERITLTP